MGFKLYKVATSISSCTTMRLSIVVSLFLYFALSVAVPLHHHNWHQTDSFVYVHLQGPSTVRVFNGYTAAQIAEIPTDGKSIDSRLLPCGNKLYVLNTSPPNSSDILDPTNPGPKMNVTVIRTRCPSDTRQWTTEERATGKCVPNTKLRSVVPTNYAFYFNPSPASGYIYLGTTAGVDVVDTSIDKVVRSFNISGLVALDISPDGKSLYAGIVNKTGAGSVQTYDTATGNTIGSAVSVDQLPITLIVSPDGKRVYTANWNPAGAPANSSRDTVASTVSIIDTTGPVLKLVTEVSLGNGSLPLSAEASLDGRTVYTANANPTFSALTASSNTVFDVRTPFTAYAMGVSRDSARLALVMVDEKYVDVNQISHVLPGYLQLYSALSFQEADFSGERHRWYSEFLVVGQMDGIGRK